MVENAGQRWTRALSICTFIYLPDFFVRIGTEHWRHLEDRLSHSCQTGMSHRLSHRHVPQACLTGMSQGCPIGCHTGMFHRQLHLRGLSEPLTFLTFGVLILPVLSPITP